MSKCDILLKKLVCKITVSVLEFSKCKPHNSLTYEVISDDFAGPAWIFKTFSVFQKEFF